MTVMAVLVTIDSPGALLPIGLNGGRSGQMSGRPRRTLKCLNIYIHTYIHTYEIFEFENVYGRTDGRTDGRRIDRYTISSPLSLRLR